jgi:hypothetical protein
MITYLNYKKHHKFKKKKKQVNKKDEVVSCRI